MVIINSDLLTGDVRNKETLITASENIDCVIHTGKFINNSFLNNQENENSQILSRKISYGISQTMK